MNPNVGRWPANVCLDEEAAAILDEQSGERPGMAGTLDGDEPSRPGYCGGWQARTPFRGAGDTGGASRFFYCAKASRAEREAGLVGSLPCIKCGGLDTLTHLDEQSREVRCVRNGHPTVKPVSLMRWLTRLVTPPGGLVLDPFAGSGTTGMACVAEGFRFIGMEKDEGYCEIARRRIAWQVKQQAAALLDPEVKPA